MESKINSQLLSLEEALTFDDVLIVPSYSSVLPHQVNISTQQRLPQPTFPNYP